MTEIGAVAVRPLAPSALPAGQVQVLGNGKSGLISQAPMTVARGEGVKWCAPPTIVIRTCGMIFTNLDQLSAEIQRDHEREAVIGVDGWTGAGKTSLAQALAVATGGTFFDLDTALDTDRGCYVEALRIDEIRSGLATGGLLFVSGICLRQVLGLVNVDAAALVYVKRMAGWGWADEDDLLGHIPDIVESGGASVRRELRRYHAEWEPHLNPRYEFHRYG